ncbi:hypothetical protein M422DRAFT_258674 [Sphaerobolus stellatus SS14]|uniref:Terpene synthase n=1 Tax=Sphaerobolus stellatus (strain SS14) TaxID=990650 RepID=A0A0C9VAH4_SPHS4|nr:hypothetical protein M422DRAFT_258674 [Sphaerobolus stellatus SS14]
MTSTGRFDSFKPNVPSRITPRLHPKTNEVISRVDEWFLRHWAFPNEAAIEDFQSSDFALFICYGEGDIHPVTQLEKILRDLFAEIRGIGTLARTSVKKLFGGLSSLPATLVRNGSPPATFWSTQPQRDNEVVSECEHLVGYHAMLVNDLFSYGREVSRTSMGEVGAALINSVLVVQNGQGIGEQGAMMWLESYCEMLDRKFEEIASTTTHLGEDVNTEDANRYIDALRLLMAGNLKWSAVCGRYNKL